MATLTTLTDAIQLVIHDGSYTDITDRINDAVNNIAAGQRMPDGSISPPLNDLFVSASVSTTTDAFTSLPANYQREVFYVVNSRGDRVPPVSGGGYYSFMLFLNNAYKKDLSQAGPLTDVCVKGRKLYYQGIPSASEDLTVSYYRKPVAMVDATDEVDGIPDHLQVRLIKHYVCKEIFGEGLEDGAESRKVGTTYHTNKFFEAMIALCDFNGEDAEPEFYANDY